jgi:hypothetical protein
MVIRSDIFVTNGSKTVNQTVANAIDAQEVSGQVV